MRYLLSYCIFLLLALQIGCKDDEAPGKVLSLVSARIGATDLSPVTTTPNVSVNVPIVLQFSAPVLREAAGAAVRLSADQNEIPVTLTFADGDKTVTVQPDESLPFKKLFTLHITDALGGSGGEVFSAITISFQTSAGELKVLNWTLGGRSRDSNLFTDAPLNMDLQIQFDKPLRENTVTPGTVSLSGPIASSLQHTVSENGKQLNIVASTKLLDLAKYTLTINSGLTGAQDESFTGFVIDFYTAPDATRDFPLISDEALLTFVQQRTFKYFWDFAHPTSGMARERNTSGDLVTSGGSGFGIMALIVGIERGFITRNEGLQRMDKILSFLEGADRFHGAWPHWLHGSTGDVVPFSANDNGGDLVETSFLMQGLLTFRQYLNGNIAAEKDLIDRINELWQGVEWDWYTRNGEEVLYWHWSPDKQWVMNHPIRGYNEALITYFLAAASPTHTINASVYHQGWASNGAIVNNKQFYGFTLPVGFDFGGPLFFAHYSFLGLDPRGLQDTYANYWEQNVNHTRINHAHSVANPKQFVGYSEENWGLTASDNRQGYAAHSPTNDLGVITPTAALSSFPYTPEESMKALKFFYYTMGDRLWGPYGFYDAFNVTEGWTAASYLAIDQGPIVVMIENHRTGLLWDLFMSAPEVQIAMDKLGFTR